jgi:membrane associated rhomboid family serine protease
MFPLKDNIPLARFPLVTVALVAINVIAYLLEIRHGGSIGVAPAQPATWQTVFTSMFLHGSFLHIFGNMLFLAIFGPTVEDSTGRGRFRVFYLLGGVVALGAQVLISPDSVVPTLGASGAIAAVLGGYVLLYPRARVLSLVFIIFFVTIVEVPAIALLGFWFVLQLAFGAAGLASPVGGTGRGEGVAYFAHVCGFAFGLLAFRLSASTRKQQPLPAT